MLAYWFGYAFFAGVFVTLDGSPVRALCAAFLWPWAVVDWLVLRARGRL